MKRDIRVLGVDDGAFSRQDKHALVVGALVRGKNQLEAVMSTRVSVDGTDSAEKIARMINQSRRKSQIKAVLVQGSTLAGFNLLDLEKLYSLTGKPVLSVYRKKPDKQKVKKALEKLGKEPIELRLSRYSKGFFSAVGMNELEARELLDSLVLTGSLPEPVRYAHVIASGLTTGESTKRA